MDKPTINCLVCKQPMTLTDRNEYVVYCECHADECHNPSLLLLTEEATALADMQQRLASLEELKRAALGFAHNNNEAKRVGPLNSLAAGRLHESREKFFAACQEFTEQRKGGPK